MSETESSDLDVLTSYDDLVARLEADGVTFRAEPEAHQVWLPVARGDFQATALLVWLPKVALVQVLVPLDFEVVQGAGPQTCEAVVRMNHTMVLPGFGVDLERGQPYVRLLTPRGPDGSVVATEVQRMLSTAVQTAAELGPALEPVAQGRISADELAATWG